MSKRKKTREQKIIAQLRRTLKTTQPASVQDLPNRTPLHLPTQFTMSVNNIHIQPRTEERAYGYVRADLTKTMYLTLGIIGAQLLFYFLLQKHLIILPFIKF